MIVGETLEAGAFEDIISSNFGSPAAELGVDFSELTDAFRHSRTERSVAEIEVAGMHFSSFREQVGVVDEYDRSRGGIEISADVNRKKIAGKAVIMQAKHRLGDTGNVGGKSGIAVSPDELRELRMHPKLRTELLKQHALMHGLDPRTNVAATDIGTNGDDMDAIAEALRPKFNDKAGAAASGVSSLYGGEPELHAPHTGFGASIMLAKYLEMIAPTNARVREAMDGGRPLRALVQGLGKAGAHFVETMPEYIQLAGAMEQHGAVMARHGETLRRQDVLDHVRANRRFDEEGVSSFRGTLWLPPTALHDFWASDSDIVVPAYDHLQFTAEDARAFGGIAVLSVANHPLTDEAQAILTQNGIDEIPDVAANCGGTISSQLLWEKIMYPSTFTPESFEAKWRQKMGEVATTLFKRRVQESRRNDTFVSLSHAAKLLIVERAVERVRRAA